VAERRACWPRALAILACSAWLLAAHGAVAAESAPGASPIEGGVAEPPPGGVARVVSLVPSVTETMFALDRGDRLVGISTFCDYPPDEVKKIPRAGSYLTPNVEVIIGLRPDVVLGVPTPGNQPAVEQLRALGLNVVIVGERTLDDTWRAIETIGRWAGNPAGAAALVARIQGEIAGVRADAARVPRRKLLFVVGHDPLVAAGTGLFIDELIDAAGGINVAASAPGAWPRLSLEAVIAAAPQVIIDSAMGSEANHGLASYWEPYASVPAVREGRLWPQRSDALLRPGPRIGRAARELFEMINAPPAAPLTGTAARS
jgi:iron complex transport system substrate-binding protein